MPEESPTYLSYLLRLWRVRGESEVWRASLENPLTRDSKGFGGLDELFDFLRRRTGLLPNRGEDEGEITSG